MVQKGLRKHLVLPCSQYPDNVPHSFTGPAPPLTLHAVAVEPVIRFRSTQVNLCVDTALAQAGDVGSVSLQIALQLVYGFQILFRSGTAPSCIHPDRNLFHDIVDSVEFPDNTIYQFPVAEAQPGPDFFMHMVAVTEMLMVLAAFYHSVKVLKLVPGTTIPIRQHRGFRQVIVSMQKAYNHCDKFFLVGRGKAVKPDQFCPVAIFSDAFVYLDAVHFRNATFLLVLEYDPVPFNRYNLKLCQAFSFVLFC